MTVIKKICEQNLFVKIAGILLYLCFYVFIVDIIWAAIVNVKNGCTTLKRELCWIAVWVLPFLMVAMSGVNILGALTVGIFGAYLPMFFLYHGFIYPVFNFTKNYLKQQKQEQKLHYLRYELKKQARIAVSEYFLQEDYNLLENKVNISKNIKLGWCEFIIDTENKKFVFFNPRSYDHSTVILDTLIEDGALTNDTLKNNTFIKENYYLLEATLLDTYICEIYNFNDLNKVEIINKSKTDEKRTYTMESKSGSAFWGAVTGSMLSETILNEYATAGAIIGASGERTITENVEKTTKIAFCVNLYLNDINNPYKTFTLKDENMLREFIGALEYIKNNK